MSEENYREWMCECGHIADEHHISWFAGSGQPIIEECEYWGWNEHGGTEWLEDEQRWIKHCYHFKRDNGNT